jgi:hypothetical protein
MVLRINGNSQFFASAKKDFDGSSVSPNYTAVMEKKLKFLCVLCASALEMV